MSTVFQTITADLEASFVISLRSRRLVDGKSDVTDFTLEVERMRGRLNVAVLSRERLLIGKMDGWPDLKTRLSTAEEVVDSAEIRHLAELVRDLAVSAVRGCQTTVNMEDLDFVFPVFKRASGYLLTTPKAVLTSKDVSKVKSIIRQLSVRVVKATQLMPSAESVPASSRPPSTAALAARMRPYVVVEVDDPRQRFKTDVGRPDGVVATTTEWNQDCLL